MTAPLPPLPEWTQVWLNEYQKASLRDHAKLAVREALKRAIARTEYGTFPQASENTDYYRAQKAWADRCVMSIRAMLEDYK